MSKCSYSIKQPAFNSFYARNQPFQHGRLPWAHASGRWDVDLPSNSGSSPRHLPVHAVSRWRAKLEVPRLWRAWWALVHGGGCPWGEHGGCTPGGQTILVSSRLGCGTGIRGVVACGGANGKRC